MTFKITKEEFRILVESGKAQSDTYANELLGNISRYEHITVRANDYSQSLFNERHGYSWKSDATGATIYLESYIGDIIEVTPIRYTKKGFDYGDTDAERINERFRKFRGGAREGAGRKPSGLPPKSVWSVKVTDEEKEMLKAYLEQIREK